MTVTLRRWTRGQRPTDRQLADLENALGRTPIFSAVRSVTAATTIVDSDDLILVDATAAPVTVTLPLASANAGRRFTVKKTDASANAVTFSGTVDGDASFDWSTRYAAYTVQSDGATWWVERNYGIGAAASVSDGDYGDVVVSVGGTVWELDASIGTFPLTANAEFNQFQALQMVLHNVTGGDPGAPATGQIWLRTDL